MTSAEGLRCVFCGAPLPPATCLWVRLLDGHDFVCCPVACQPLIDAAAALRRDSAAARAQLALPLVTA